MNEYRRERSAVCAVLAVMATIGCAKLPTAPESTLPKYSVISVLWNTGEPNYVFLYPVVPIGQKPEFEQRAQVSIAWAGRTVRLALARSPFGPDSSVYADSLERVEVVPGTTYDLRIETPDGERIRGVTTVPGEFSILAPVAGDTVRTDSAYVRLELAWTESEGAAGYLVYVQRPPFELDPGYIYEPPPASFLAGKGCRWSGWIWVPPGLNTMDVGVLAFDRNYYQHVFRGANVAGVENALGVFGSMLWRHVELVVVRTQ